MRYRFARTLATRINAPTYRPSPSFPARWLPGPDLIPMTETRTLVLIPARMGATRLPGKPLLDIAGLPMIVQVLRRAEAAQIGRVAVATDTPEIAAAVTSHGGEAVMTRASCRSRANTSWHWTPEPARSSAASAITAVWI